MAKLHNVGSLDNPIYLIGSAQNWTLIEGGLSAQYTSVKAKLLAVLGDLSKIKHWIILHSHYDHCGLLSYLYDDLPEVEVYAGEKSCLNFGRPKSIEVIETLNRSVIELQDSMSSFIGVSKTPMQSIPVQYLKAERILKCGEELTFHIIPTPGHSDCSIALLEYHTGQLFASDALGEYLPNSEWFPLAFSDISAYLQSISILERTAPKSVALGHGGVLKDQEIAHVFQKSKVATHRLIEEVQNSLKVTNSKSIAKTLHQQYAYNSTGFVPEHLHYLSMKRLVDLIAAY